VAGRAARLLLPILALILGVETRSIPAALQDLLQTGLSLFLIGTAAFLLYQSVKAAEELVLQRYRIDVSDNLQARAVYTQGTVARKIAAAVIALFTVASMLMLFEPVRQLGTSILAPAGIAGIIIGFAAQQSIATLLAGLQIAVTQPIRLDDVVIVENEWGRIEDITLTYVTVRIWDQRRLVVPITYFIEKPFQNWTRTSAEILGTVYRGVRARHALLGIDVGGTGIKGAPVDTATGALLADRFRLRTPRPATPERVAETVAAIVTHFEWRGAVGCGFPAVIRHGEVCTAANIDEGWIGTNARSLFEDATGCTVTLANDADAAGPAEIAFGAGRGRTGVVLVVTLGTGIGTALFVDGRLVPNTELGHIELRGKDAERYAAGSVRVRKGLTWKQWARRVDRYLVAIHALLWPDLIVVGGGAVKKHERFLPLLTVEAEVVPAQLRNEAGIVGAALAASRAEGRPPRRPPSRRGARAHR